MVIWARRVLALIAAFLALGVLALCNPAHAAECGTGAKPVSEVLSVLEKRYGELSFWTGDSGGGRPTVILTINPSGTSWTIIVVGPDGCAAPVAAGDSWRPGTTLIGEDG